MSKEVKITADEARQIYNESLSGSQLILDELYKKIKKAAKSERILKEYIPRGALEVYHKDIKPALISDGYDVEIKEYRDDIPAIQVAGTINIIW